MRPAQERLNTEDVSVTEPDDRLIRKAELVRRQRNPEAVANPQPVLTAQAHLIVVDSVLSRARILGVRQCRVRVADQRRERFANLLQRNAKAGSNSHGLATDLDCWIEQSADDRGGGVRPGEVDDEGRGDRELIAAVACHQELGEGFGQTARNLEQHGVADRMAETSR